MIDGFPAGCCVCGATLAVTQTAHLGEIFHIRARLLIVGRRFSWMDGNDLPPGTRVSFFLLRHSFISSTPTRRTKSLGFFFFSFFLSFFGFLIWPSPPTLLELLHSMLQCGAAARRCPWDAVKQLPGLLSHRPNPAFLHLFPRQLTFKGAAALLIDCLPFAWRSAPTKCVFSVSSRHHGAALVTMSLLAGL